MGNELIAEISTRIFQPNDWQIYKDLRLRALKDSPDAFGTTYHDACKYPESLWQARLENVSEKFDHPVRGDVDNLPIGMAWGRI